MSVSQVQLHLLPLDVDYTCYRILFPVIGKRVTEVQPTANLFSCCVY